MNQRCIINWLDFNEESVRDVYPMIFRDLNERLDEAKNKNIEPRSFTYVVNILVICEDKYKSNKDPKFFCEIKEKFKIMNSALEIGIKIVATVDNNEYHPEITITSKNIKNDNIIKWCPIYQALPINFC